MERRRALGLIILYEGGLGVVAVSIGYFTNWHFWKHLSWNTGLFFQSVLATIPMFVFFYLIFKLPLPAFTRIVAEIQEIIPLLFGKLKFFDLLFASFLAGLGEELLFRGLMQYHITGFIGQIPSLLIVSIAFGLAHLITFGYAIIATIYGLYLGLLALYFDNLLSPIIAHTFYDFIALVYYMYFGKNSPNEKLGNRNDKN
ncbi:MAG: CPBP family intramembrane metalloprotease [Leptospiraceae bacterium]|nr:CPBP family intramembrane metalloprotease [Leptospiraceae bacterium]MCP5493830.1 CPBP family intramembrane metalloprotease [Leptospiraceae bacterium]